MPDLIDYDENYLVIERINGETLRKSLLENNELLCCSKVIIELFDRKYKKSSEKLSWQLINQSFKRSYGNLICSGPEDASKLGLISVKIRKVFIKLSYAFLKKDFVKISKKLALSEDAYYLHGDLHLNNIIVNGSRYYLIDWETSYSGVRINDIIYFLPQYAILSKDLNAMLGWEYFGLSSVETKVLKNIYPLYLSAIMTNPRFHREQLTFFQELSAWLKLSLNIIKIKLQKK